jgi:anti-sigma regulatory factor (Ser/Thr protein kinase)
MEKHGETKKILLVNQLKELETINQYLEELSGAWDLSLPLTMKLNLVLEEAFTNIVNYGFRDDKIHEITLVFKKENNCLHISLIDDGIPYDPTKASDPDINLSAEEREIGGLGIHLIRKMMDSVSYQRVGETNVLNMEKTINTN